MKKIKWLIMALFMSMVFPMAAQAQDFGLDISAGIKKEFLAMFYAKAVANVRTNDNTTDMERFAIRAGLGFELVVVRLELGYTFLYYNFRNPFSGYGDEEKHFGLPSHRFYANLAGMLPLGNFKLSLRAGYQFTHFGEKEIGGTRGPDTEVKVGGNNAHIFRTRIKAQYTIGESGFTPYAALEFYDDLKDKFDLDTLRVTGGVVFNFLDFNNIELYYRYVAAMDKGAEDMHYIGLKYLADF